MSIQKKPDYFFNNFLDILNLWKKSKGLDKKICFVGVQAELQNLEKYDTKLHQKAKKLFLESL
jgi:hypothetical protein